MPGEWPLEVPSLLSTSMVEAYGESACAWLDELPRLAREICRRWLLSVTGQARSGFAGVVLPVERQDQMPAMLKLTYPQAQQATPESCSLLCGHVGHHGSGACGDDPGNGPVGS